MLEIFFKKEIIENWDELAYEGQITIGDWKEKFYSPAVFWKKEDYLKSWKNEIKKILDNKSQCAKLFTTMHSPETMNFCRAWILYVDQNKIYVQEKIFFVDNFDIPFELKQIYDLKLERETIDEDENKISEWEATIQDLRKLYQELKESVA